MYKYITESKSDADVSTLATTAERVEEFSDVREEALAILESQLLNYHSRSSSVLEPDADGDASAKAGAGAGATGGLARVYATGGASANRTILSLMADVFSTNICKLAELPEQAPAGNKGKRQWKDADWNACSVGMAYKARWGWERACAQAHAQAGEHGDEGSERRWIGFDTVVSECRERRKLRREQSSVPQPVLQQAKGDDDEEEGEEGVRVVASPGPGAAAYTQRVEWWRAFEARALRDQSAAKEE